MVKSIFAATEPVLSCTAQPTVSLQCTKCFTYVGQGKSHTCNRTTRRANLEKLVKSSSRKTKGRVTGACIKAVFEDDGVDIRGGTAAVPSGSRCPLKITLGTVEESPKLSADNMMKLQTAFNFSDKTTL